MKSDAMIVPQQPRKEKPRPKKQPAARAAGMLAFLESLCYTLRQAGVVELADATDSKSVAREGIRVRPPSPAHQNPYRIRVLLIPGQAEGGSAVKYRKAVTLKDGRTCVIRNGTEQDAEGVLSNFILTHGEDGLPDDLSGRDLCHTGAGKGLSQEEDGKCR